MGPGRTRQRAVAFHRRPLAVWPRSLATLAAMRAPLARRQGGALAALRARPRVAAGLSLWLIGLLLAFGAVPAPIAITPAALAAYKSGLKRASAAASEVAATERAAARARLEADAATPWFWRFKDSETRARVRQARARVAAFEREADARLQEVRRKGERGTSASAAGEPCHPILPLPPDQRPPGRCQIPARPLVRGGRARGAVALPVSV